MSPPGSQGAETISAGRRCMSAIAEHLVARGKVEAIAGDAKKWRRPHLDRAVRPRGKTHRMTLGSVAVFDPGKVRAIAKDLLAAVRLGRDPAGERRLAPIQNLE